MKFKYGDKVKVIKGFYRGRKGVVRDYWSVCRIFKDYWIRFDDGWHGRFMKGKDLELIKK